MIQIYISYNSVNTSSWRVVPSSFLLEAYPEIHNSSNVDFKELGAPGEPFSLLYRVRANQNTSRANDASTLPYLLMAHLDVVPVEEENWHYKPFAADVEDGFVYARGSIDDKNNAIVREPESLKAKLQFMVRT